MTGLSNRRGRSRGRRLLPVLPVLVLSLTPAPARAGVASAPPRSDGHATSATATTPMLAGTIRGRVTDESGGPVGSAQVVIAGTQIGALADNNGNFIIRNAPTGTHSLRVTRIGFTPRTVPVTVPEGGDVTVDVRLEHAATRLEEVVTTATGQQSRREFGNVVATINADSITSKLPVTNVQEVLQARTSGVQVVQGWGQTGQSSSIRIRGISSLSLSNEPLVIVDGVRFDNGGNPSAFTTGRVNLLSTFNPDEIESIDVLKGPSAASLYGTAAANGVIVIKTKRGQAGPTNWTLYGEAGQVENPGGHEGNYWSWGRSRNTTTGAIGTTPVQCRIASRSLNTCVIDSLNTFNPWTEAATNPFKTQPRAMMGAQASGGTDRFRYFVSAEHERETGPYHMPDFEVQRIATERGQSPTSREVNPNRLYQNAVRGNFTVNLRPDLSVDVNTGYIRRDLWSAFEGTFFAGMTFQYITAPGYKTSTNGLQREFVGDVFGIENGLRDDRFTGSAALNYQPLSWLSTRAVLGLDQNNSFGYRQQRRGQGARVGVSWGPNGQEGGKDFDRSNNSQYSVDLGATATHDIRPSLSSRTSVGGQWFFNATYSSQGRGYGLPVGFVTPNAARLRESWEFTTESKQYGAYIEEQLGWRDRLFVTGGARTDQTSAFGRNVGNTVYPRAAVSWVASDEEFFAPARGFIPRLRLRAAVGRAGVNPGTLAALQYLGARNYPAGTAADEPGLRIASLGNQNLKPEVTTEVEAGFDAGFLDDRLNFEVTTFRKVSRDALYNAPKAPSEGTSEGTNAPSQWQNLARVENRGVELAVDAQIVRTTPVSWNLRLNGSRIKNRLVTAGAVVLPSAPGIRHAVGYPLFGLWDRELLSYSDANSDGILTDAEIVVSDEQRYRGSSLPEFEAGLTNTFGFLDNRVQLTALFDYRGKFYKYWFTEQYRCVSAFNCKAVNDPGASLEDQAAAVAAASGSKRTNWGYFVPNDFVKFRELSLSFTMPERLVARFLRGRSTSLVLSGRNLGYPWSKYPGLDPEANDVVGDNGSGNRALTAQPPLRYYLARINVAF